MTRRYLNAEGLMVMRLDVTLHRDDLVAALALNPLYEPVRDQLDWRYAGQMIRQMAEKHGPALAKAWQLKRAELAARDLRVEVAELETRWYAARYDVERLFVSPQSSGPTDPSDRPPRSSQSGR